MKRFFLFLVLFVFNIQFSNAQYRMSKSGKGFAVAAKANVLSLMVNSLNLSLETRIKGKHSIQGVIQINHRRNRHSTWYMANGDHMITSGYSWGIEYRYYFEAEKDVFRGWYVSPYFRYIYRNVYYTPDDHNPPSVPYSSISFKRDVYSYGVIVGCQNILNFGFGGIDFFAGIGRREKTDYDFEYEYKLYKINDFIDGDGEIRLGFNILLTNVK